MIIVRRHRLALEVGLLALVAYLAALGVSTAVQNRLAEGPPPPAEDARPAPAPVAPLADFAVITERDVFNPTPVAAGPRSGSDAAGLRLWGVALAGREARAVIEDPASHRQELVRVGDRIAGTRVAAIDWDRVTLDDGGGETTLELRPPPPATAADTDEPAPPATAAAAIAGDERIRRTAENAYVVDRRALAGAVDNMSGLLTQLRAVAEVRDGRPAGFRLFQIRDDSLFARLGLHDGDVVQRVNGSPIADPAALLAFLQRLQTEPRVALDIVRRDAPRTLVYDLR